MVDQDRQRFIEESQQGFRELHEGKGKDWEEVKKSLGPDKLLALCEMTTECPGQQEPFQGKTLLCAGTKCLVCCGTGRVYLLDPDGKFGLRVKCRGCNRCVFGEAKDIQSWYDIDICQGRGWLPSTELMLYVRAAWAILGIETFRVIARITNALDDGTDPGQAAFDVVWKALKETPASVRVSEVEHSCGGDASKGTDRQHVITAVVALDGQYQWPSVAQGTQAAYCPWCGWKLPKEKP